LSENTKKRREPSRRRGQLPIDVKSLARSYTELCVRSLSGIAKDGKSEPARVAASEALLNRGWGKPAQPHTGEEGGAIEIVLRNIMEEKKKSE
jgi:hypothetical protein